MSREIAGRHFEFEYRNEHTNGGWVRTDFGKPIPETRCEAEQMLEEIVKRWVGGTELRWVLVNISTEYGVPVAHKPDEWTK